MRAAPTESMPKQYVHCAPAFWYLVTDKACGLLRDHVLQPLDVSVPPIPGRGAVAFSDMNSGIELPSWHCCFQNCEACGSGREGNADNHVAAWWHHIMEHHREPLETILRQHMPSEACPSETEMCELIHTLVCVASNCRKRTKGRS